MQSQERQYQSNPNFSRLKYPILSSQVHKALLSMISQKVFHMLEMRQEKVMNKLLKAKKGRQLQEIKQMVMLNLQICWNLTAIQPSLHRIHAIWFLSPRIELISDYMSTNSQLFHKRLKLSLSLEYLQEER